MSGSDPTILVVVDEPHVLYSKCTQSCVIMVHIKKHSTARSANLHKKATLLGVHRSPYKMHSMVVVVCGDETQQELTVYAAREGHL